ncbi:MAG: 4Fe-4S binding protein, partial [Firmicutes bacterium]|nr:4Fe-4S binding protein [Bacillota bacterium]
CFGLCAKGPIVIIYPEGTFYQHVFPKDVTEIVDSHLVGGKVVTRLENPEKYSDGKSKPLFETSFYKSQNRLVLKNCGFIDPENIEEYIALDGYLAYAKCVQQMQPIDVINLLIDANLRGRGGGGFSAGKKWLAAYNAPGNEKYIVCNADEGDPGAFMDRSIIEGDPHAVIEAMMIAGYSIGAKMGYVYVRAEYPIAVQRLLLAIKQAREYGILGKNALGLGHEFDIDVRLGAGAFVCGESSALITSIEGNRGEPKQKPPNMAIQGLWGKPTVLNNVETFGNIPQIILKGVDWFKSIGTAGNSGTKVFALGGKIVNTGLVEVPMGTTLRTVIDDIGGGCMDGKKFKAAQTGGPSGGCIPTSLIDTAIDFDSLTKIGSMMGSGGLIVMDETSCMVDIAKFFLDFTVEESCGKCTPCRIGNKRLYEILVRISEGKGKIEDIKQMEELCEYIKRTSLCGLGQTAPNPVISTMKYFMDEYLAHINDKRCPAGVCKDLLQFVVNDKCIGCTLCKKVCPADAITGNLKEKHKIDQEKCAKCGLCIPKCKFKAIDRI